MNRVMLYIEDDDNNISLVEALLKRRPQIELQVAMNGRDGVQSAIDKQPRLILLDNRLPDATGSEILGELASLPATAAIPVVVLSSDAERRHSSAGGQRSHRSCPEAVRYSRVHCHARSLLSLTTVERQATSSDSPVKASQRAA